MIGRGDVGMLRHEHRPLQLQFLLAVRLGLSVLALRRGKLRQVAEAVADVRVLLAATTPDHFECPLLKRLGPDILFQIPIDTAKITVGLSDSRVAVGPLRQPDLESSLEQRYCPLRITSAVIQHAQFGSRSCW